MLPARHTSNNAWLPEFFNDFFDNRYFDQTRATAPAINVLENDKAYELELAAAGMTKEDFQVNLDKEGDLVIKMEKKFNKEEKTAENRGHYLRREFSYSKYQQTMLLPDDAEREKITATVENGVLKVFIPKIAKVAPENTNKVIEVK